MKAILVSLQDRAKSDTKPRIVVKFKFEGETQVRTGQFWLKDSTPQVFFRRDIFPLEHKSFCEAFNILLQETKADAEFKANMTRAFYNVSLPAHLQERR